MDPRVDHSPSWYRLELVAALFVAALLVAVAAAVVAVASGASTPVLVRVSMGCFAVLVGYVAAADVATSWRRRRV